MTSLSDSSALYSLSTKNCLYQLRRHHKGQTLLTLSNADKLMHASLSCRLDYCNALSEGGPAFRSITDCSLFKCGGSHPEQNQEGPRLPSTLSSSQLLWLYLSFIINWLCSGLHGSTSWLTFLTFYLAWV